MEKEKLESYLNDGLSTRDIQNITGLHRNTISYWIKKYNLTESMKFKKNESFCFGEIDSKEKAYCLGFILADGAISKNNIEISVAMDDKEVLEFISKTINSNVNYDFSYDKALKRFPRARTHKKIEDITKFIGGTLKEFRHFPRVRKDLQKYLLLGIFDADGCVTWGHRKDRNRLWHKITFSSSLKILTGVQQYLYKELNISTIVRPRSDENCSILEFANKKDILVFLNHIYSDSDFIILKRKQLKALALRLKLGEFGET